MLFLLPPSETKASGGKNLNISQVALTFGGLNPARDAVYAALEALCKKPRKAAEVLKLSKKQLNEIEINLQVQTGPIMPALDRYQGTLYDALHGRGLKGSATEHNTLGEAARKRAKESVLIQSALFGLIPASDMIPQYRLSASTVLPALAKRGGLKTVWSIAHEAIWPRLASRGPIIDLRSKGYVDLAPIDASIEHYWVDVLVESADGSRKPMNHFNKKAKGQFVKAVLESPTEVKAISDLHECAKAAGLKLETSRDCLLLITS
jgi:cytoplasmic iron level regulating protein YaaA (DUF328/UPF0246 family)